MTAVASPQVGRRVAIPTPAPALREVHDVDSYRCAICGHSQGTEVAQLRLARGNTARFAAQRFRLWTCPICRSLHSVDRVDLEAIYRDYALSRRRLDHFARGALGNLRARLRRAGLRRDHSVLDYGCGNGLFVDYLRGKGQRDVVGYDPYVEGYDSVPARAGGFDCLVLNDVIEHVDDPSALLGRCLELVRPGGLLYVGTADSAGVGEGALDAELMRLHQPFHRVIMSEFGLLALGWRHGLTLVAAHRRSYMDTLIPFVNYRFLDELHRAAGGVMDRLFEPGVERLLLRRPKLLLHGLFGYWFPSAHEPAAVWRKPAGGQQ